MATSDTSYDFEQHVPEIRIILVGNVKSGKSSAGNTILGGEEFELKGTSECVKRQGQVAGRQITVVEAPGWRNTKFEFCEPRVFREEIALGVSLCPPGPHAVLIVMNLTKRILDEHINDLLKNLELLTDGVWSHTLVLFTYGDWLGDTAIEQHIESEGKQLQWLVEKCGNRYHVLNNKNRSDDTQVTELLEKIEEMVAGNGVGHLELDRKILQELEEIQEKNKMRGKLRLMKVQNQRQSLRSKMGDHFPLSELRIVLLGHRCAGKSSAGNTILGREEFGLKGTAECVKRQGQVAGRQITVVEAPGWGSVRYGVLTSNLTKQEICYSISMCQPGPHCVLLVIDANGSFTDEWQIVVFEHLRLLDANVWSHTLVLFTNGDCLGDTAIEQHIESEGKQLQCLVEKCGNRYHVLNNINRSDDTQVTELLEKIEEMVAGNGGKCYEMERKIVEELKARRREERNKMKERIVMQKRITDRPSQCDTHHLSELRIVMLGNRCAGKSSAGNTILGREEFELKRTAECVKRQGQVAGRQITVVEAPGWWNNKPVEFSTELLKQEIVFSVSLCPPGPHAVLLLIRSDTLFKENEKRVVEGYLQLLSERVWSHTLVLFIFGDWLGDTAIEQHIESEGKQLQCLVEKCGNRYHVLNNINRSDYTQVTELLEKIEEMVAANSLEHFQLDTKILLELQEKRRQEERRLKERRMLVQKQREDIRSHMCDTHHLSELRIVMLGYRYAGKSSAGNTILGREEFELKRTAECVKRQGQVAGRQITVVEAPGWWINKPVEFSAELLKQEIVFSVSLCPPGPHAVLLLIRADSVFKEAERTVVEGYLQLLSERVWSHTLVLFTYGDWLGDTAIEQHIESEGKQLQWLVEKCGNRYHVLNNKNRSDDTQVTELLEKIEEMVAANSLEHFELDTKMLLELQEKRRQEERRLKERRMLVQKQREDIRSHMCDTHHLSELRIVLLGYRCAGKSSAGNTILGREEFDLKGTAECVKRQGQVAGRQITVVEAPGWWINEPVEESTELLEQEIVLSVSLCPPGPHAVLLLIRADIVFKEAERTVVEGYLQLLSERVWSHTLVLFTYGDCLGDTAIEQHIESEGKQLQCLVEKCGNRYHVLNNINRSDDTQVTELLEKIEEMVAANSLEHLLKFGSVSRNMILKNVSDGLKYLLTKADENPHSAHSSLKQQIGAGSGSCYTSKRFTVSAHSSGYESFTSESSNTKKSSGEDMTLMIHDKSVGAKRRTSPVPSELSMMSDWSMGEPANFSGSFPHDHKRIKSKPAESEEIIHKFEQTQLHPTSSSPGYAGPGDVACNICTEAKQKAVKTCLTCTASYCEDHVRQHYTEADLYTHKLVEATTDLS